MLAQGVQTGEMNPNGPGRPDPYFCDWAEVVGRRVRRLRHERDWTLVDLARRVHKPEGGHYSGGYFSRLERGWASAPLYVYLVTAAHFGVRPGLLLGADDLQKEVTPAQDALLRVVDRMGITPEEAIVRLAVTVTGRTTGAGAR